MAILTKENIYFGWLTVQRFSPLSSWQEAWRHAGKHDAREVAESPTSF